MVWRMPLGVSTQSATIHRTIGAMVYCICTLYPLDYHRHSCSGPSIYRWRPYTSYYSHWPQYVQCTRHYCLCFCLSSCGFQQLSQPWRSKFSWMVSNHCVGNNYELGHIDGVRYYWFPRVWIRCQIKCLSQLCYRWYHYQHWQTCTWYQHDSYYPVSRVMMMMMMITMYLTYVTVEWGLILLVNVYWNTLV